MTATPVKAFDEKFCIECRAVIKAKAEMCPNCGVQVGAQSTSNFAAPITPKNKNDEGKVVDFWLGVGIVLMPYIFAWFLLRNGYSMRSRAISFIWMAVVALPLLTKHS